MHRMTILCLIGGLSVMLGMSGEGCQVDNGLLPGLAKPLTIIPTNPDEETLLRTFRVDLSGYPQARTINWSFGDGSMAVNLPVATGQRAAHEFTRAGTFEVSVFLFSDKDYINNTGAKMIASSSLPVEVVGPNQLPVAKFIVQDVKNADGFIVAKTKKFVATSSRDPDGTIKSFEWDFGDGKGGSGATIEHTYDLSARYVVRLTVRDDRGGTDTTTRTLLLNEVPTASFTFEVDGNDALRFNFDASASSDPDGEIRSYRWDFGDGTAIGTGVTTSHRYTVPDNYDVTLTVIDDFGASISTTQMVDVTGSEPFVRSVTPPDGEVDTTVTDAVIDGENFEDGATVRLERGNDVIDGTSVVVQDATTMLASFDLTGADLGDYKVVVVNPDNATAELADGFRVVTANLVRLETSFGDVVFELVDDAPITTANFLQYVEDRFYDGTIFHRVVNGFVVQGGGFIPGPGIGTPQEGLRDPIQNEFSPTRSNVRATVAMAKLGDDPDSATSQFFVNLADNSSNLDNQNGGFTVFANVIEGMDVIDAIAQVEVDSNSRPVEDIILISARRE